MSFNLLPVANAVVMLCDAINVCNSVNKMQDSTDIAVLDKLHTINRIALLGFSLAQAGMEINKVSAKDLATLKTIECFPRVAEIGFRCAKEAFLLEKEKQEADSLRHRKEAFLLKKKKEADSLWYRKEVFILEKEKQEADSLKRYLPLIEKGLLAPTADAIRVFAELRAYQEQSLLSPEERTKTEIVNTDENGFPIEVAPLNKEEHIASKADWEKVAVVSSFVRGSLEVGVISSAASEQNIYLRLALYFRDLIGLPEDPAKGIRQTKLRELKRNLLQSLKEIQSIIDFQRLEEIPPPLYQDPVFCRYICPITNLPIRDPVGDPTNSQILYERKAITGWLYYRIAANLPLVSPVTHLPITIATLIAKPALKLLIDHRLGFFQKALFRHMNTPEFQANFAAAITPEQQALQAYADQENPNV
jgi:hypothetical protein